MNKIKCPNCGEVFEIDESKYSEIVAQVRNEQFEKEVSAQKDAFRREQEEPVFRESQYPDKQRKINGVRPFGRVPFPLTI